MPISPPPGEPGGPTPVPRAPSVPRAGYPPIGRPPGPQHSRATGSTGWHLVRIVALCAFAVALITVPMAWVQHDDARADADSALVDNPENGRAPEADTLAFSTTEPDRADEPSPSASTQPTASPSSAAPAPSTAPSAAPQPTATSQARAAAPGAGSAAAPVVPAPAPVAPPPAQPTTEPPVVPAPQTALSNEIVVLTNAERAKGGLAPLTVSACLTDQINHRTAVLVQEGRFEHDPLQPVVDACGMGSGMGENLILGYSSAAAAVQGWMDSPGHRDNLMNPRYTKIGVGCTLGPRGQLCGQIFTG